jgi:hypothetical protein
MESAARAHGPPLRGQGSTLYSLPAIAKERPGQIIYRRLRPHAGGVEIAVAAASCGARDRRTFRGSWLLWGRRAGSRRLFAAWRRQDAGPEDKPDVVE